jgi:DNA-binding PadR family transcriptional regulator
MAMKNNTQYAILGILSIAPGSGYDIKKYCDTVISNVWHENFGHIYPVLKSLLTAGLIRETAAARDSRKKVYEITDAGWETFLIWLREPAHYAPVRSEFMLKFLFSNTLPRENIRQMIAEYKIRHEEHYKSFTKMEEDLAHSPQIISPDRRPYVQATLRYGLKSSKAALEWCDEVSGMFAEENNTEF